MLCLYKVRQNLLLDLFLICFILLIFLVCVIFLSCGFVDLREVSVDIFPDDNSVLPDEFTPVKISFNTAMDKYSAENILIVNSDAGVVKGDKYWNDNELFFSPVGGWTAGIRYNLSFSGVVYAVDGRELRVMRYVSFYAINRNEPPVLNSYTPGNGSSISAENFRMVLNFSRSMERLSVETALVIDGITDKKYEWSNNDATLVITTDKSLAPWNHYNWNLKESAKSLDGVPFAQAVSAQFYTDLNRVIPCVEKVYPVLYADGCWYPTGLSVEDGLGINQAIAVEFSKPMSDNVLRCVSIEPSISLRTEFMTESGVICIFTKNPEPETTYEFKVSKDAKDKEGLTLLDDFNFFFTPDIQYLKIVSILPDNDSVIDDFNVNSVYQITAAPSLNNISLTFYFSHPLGNSEKQNIPLKINLNPFFPASLSPVALTDIYWVSDYKLRLTWDGISTGKDEERHYYKLTIPGGKNGIVCGNAYLKENFDLLLEAVHD